MATKKGAPGAASASASAEEGVLTIVPPPRPHEDTAQFQRVATYLAELYGECLLMIERHEGHGGHGGHGPHARRWRRLSDAVEDALFQASQGRHEAHYAQHEGTGAADRPA